MDGKSDSPIADGGGSVSDSATLAFDVFDAAPSSLAPSSSQSRDCSPGPSSIADGNAALLSQNTLAPSPRTANSTPENLSEGDYGILGVHTPHVGLGIADSEVFSDAKFFIVAPCSQK